MEHDKLTVGSGMLYFSRFIHFDGLSEIVCRRIQ